MNAQKRLTASVMNCGKEKLWLDPSESKDISMANSSKILILFCCLIESYSYVRSHVDNLIYTIICEVNFYNESLTLKVRIMYIYIVLFCYMKKYFSKTFPYSTFIGFSGKRKGTREARQPTKFLWMNRMRVLRRFLLNYREKNKIDKHMYHEMYMKVKGGVFKNKRVLMESIHKYTVEKAREKTLSDQFETKRVKNKASRERKLARREKRLARGAGGGEIAVVS
ncbi:unnamed protein product [Brassica rapa]|uniref:Large ribosomal subunit protein eL19 domain-containing protein n=1 Tax=Brassica campestris TaxID=3711 RepID=A0A3P5ZE03_BRACM|nr:unnamed protein product [Brassica rapa]VDC72393.1 unnamed protein product [Brassica rapa]